MARFTRSLAFVAALYAIAITAGCASQSHLNPAASATTTRGADAVSQPPTTSVSTTPGTITEPTPPPQPPAIPFHLTDPGSSMTCYQATLSGSAEAVVSAFRAARIAGKGAEFCASAEALANYCTARHPCGPELFDGPQAPSPGPICLYVCAGRTVRSIELGFAQKLPSGDVIVELTVDGSPPAPGRGLLIDNETVTVGPGVPSGSTKSRPMVITDAATFG